MVPQKAALDSAVGATSEAKNPTVGTGQPTADVWLIDTHEATWQTDLAEALSTVRYWQLAGEGIWEPVDQHRFFSEIARPAPTVIYIHGNWADPPTAIQQAWTIYQPIWKAAGHRPSRSIIWSWPAERTSARLLTDLRFKAGRSDVEAYLLARHLERMDRSTPILLVGYSFGARVITGALHLVGGGWLMGRSLRSHSSGASEASSADHEQPLVGIGNSSTDAPDHLLLGRVDMSNSSDLPIRFRAVLVAAAIGNDWLLPGGRHQQALGQLEKMLVTVNRADPALRRYHRLEPGDSPALGWAGPPGGACPDYPADQNDPTAKIEWLWVTSSVGKEHNWRLYLQTPELQARLPEYLFDCPKPPKNP